jgi:hypothetical protein
MLPSTTPTGRRRGRSPWREATGSILVREFRPAPTRFEMVSLNRRRYSGASSPRWEWLDCERLTPCRDCPETRGNRRHLVMRTSRSSRIMPLDQSTRHIELAHLLNALHYHQLTTKTENALRSGEQKCLFMRKKLINENFAPSHNIAKIAVARAYVLAICFIKSQCWAERSADFSAHFLSSASRMT